MPKAFFWKARILMALYNTLPSNSLLLLGTLCFGGSEIMVKATSAADYYVSPNGSDSNPGTLAQPWKTLEHAFMQLAPGDILNLRGGAYHYPRAGGYGMETSLKGTASAPIVIQSYAGERAWITGGVPYLDAAPNSEWELVDASTHVYRSKRTFSFNNEWLGGWLLDHDVQLISYRDYETLITTKYEAPDHYAGPGIYWSNDGHIFIRLQQNPLDLMDFEGNPIPPLFSDPDPNHHRISISSNYAAIGLGGASHIRFQNLDIGPASITVVIDNSSHHIEIAGCRIIFKIIAIRSENYSSDLEVHHNEITAGFPLWNYWDDVKEGSQPASAGEGHAMAGLWIDSHIHHNVIRNSFNGIAFDEGSINTQVTENFIIAVKDDAVTLPPTVVDIEIARNVIRHSYAGISITTEDDLAAPGGNVYVHHNIIDLTSFHRVARAGNLGENREEDLFAYDAFGNAWSTGIAFGSHGCNEVFCISARWKVYNNTIIGLQAGTYAKMLQRSIQNPEAYFYNNVFYNIGGGPVLSGDELYKPSMGMHWDGNIYWRTAAEGFLFHGFGGGDYPSLKEFLADPGTAPWERTNALQIDPGFDVEAIKERNDNLETIRDLYRPGNPLVLTPGVSYDGLEWPGTENVTYRGAIATLVSNILQNSIEVPDEFHLDQNYPNPFNPSTTISFDLPLNSHVVLTIYDINGEAVCNLVDEFRVAGKYELNWNGMDGAGAMVASGIYFYRIEASNHAIIKKMLFLR